MQNQAAQNTAVNSSTIKGDKKPAFLLEHSYWDIMPVTLGIFHFCYMIALFVLFPQLPMWALIPMGLFYSYLVAWNIESVAHNFVHNPYFKSRVLNRAFSLMESICIGFSQQFYKTVHIRHHIGNSDLPDKDGNTRDWFSIYRYGKNGEAENVWRYSLLGYFRGDDKMVFREMGRNNRVHDVRQAKIETYAYLGTFVLGFILNWKFMFFFLPFYYLGHVFSMMVGYYEHYMANPNVAIAWGVSTYGRFYNFFWMNNGYHAEHHYRPKIHWRKMKQLRQMIREKQHENNVHVIKYPHLLGFLQDRVAE